MFFRLPKTIEKDFARIDFYHAVWIDKLAQVSILFRITKIYKKFSERTTKNNILYLSIRHSIFVAFVNTTIVENIEATKMFQTWD